MSKRQQTETIEEKVKDIDFNYKMSNKELDSYIRLMTKDVDSRLKSVREAGIDFNKMNPAFLNTLSHSRLKYKHNRYGEQTTTLAVGLTKEVDGKVKTISKTEKVRRAKDLQAFIKNDAYTPQSFKQSKLASKRAFNKFKQNVKDKKKHGLENMKFKEWQDIIYMSEAISDIFKDYGSEIQSIYHKYQGQTNIIDFSTMARSVYASTPKGTSETEYRNALLKGLKKELKSTLDVVNRKKKR